MPYKQTATQCVVRLIALRGLASATRAQCQALRAEAGRLWTDLVALHTQAREHGQWRSASELEQATKGGQYALHSQSVQALCQKLAANVDTATELRRQELAETGRIQTHYPRHSKAYQTVVWKDQALTVLLTGQLRLPCGGQRPPLLLPLPAWLPAHAAAAQTQGTGERQSVPPTTRPPSPGSAQGGGLLPG
jgi:hypothetical protein